MTGEGGVTSDGCAASFQQCGELGLVVGRHDRIVGAAGDEDVFPLEGSGCGGLI